MKKVFLLDTGINLNNIYTKRTINTYVIKDDKVLKSTDCYDKLGHGTAIANTLLKNNDIELNVIKIFDNDYTCNVENLLNGLKYIASFNNVFLVHMSLGVRRYNYELEKICKDLFEKGVILVAACDNGMVMSYPASFDFVISVAPSYRCISTNQFVFVNNSPINLKAKAGGQQMIIDDNTTKIIQTGASFAAAHVSAKILSWNEPLNLKQILQKFKEISVYQYDFEKETPTKKLFNINKAVIFPYNKENHSLIKYDGLLNFEITNVFDIKFSSQVGKTIKSFYGNQYTISDIKDCDWSSFDTFILGHVDELSVIYNQDLKANIISLCKKYKKKLYMYDDFSLEKGSFGGFDNELDVFFPNNHIKNNSNKFGWYYQHNTPIIAVLGTSKKQGKFTLQLQLRRIFLRQGINVGQVGTEPSSLLFGMDDMFTFGYFSNNNNSIDAITECLNKKIHNVDILNKDIIIVGSQSAFLPFNTYNSNNVNLLQFSFLYATVPDGVILTVNIYDENDYIKRTIETLWNLTNSKVFMIAIYPFEVTYDRVIDSNKKKISKERLQELVNHFEKTFNIPTIVIGENEYDEKILTTVYNFFK